jgi:hypothetical protein
VTVYLATKHFDYEGDRLLGVFSTRDRAFDALVADVHIDPDEPEFDSVYGDAFYVEAWEVDGKSTHEEVYPETLIRTARERRGGKP